MSFLQSETSAAAAAIASANSTILDSIASDITKIDELMRDQLDKVIMATWWEASPPPTPKPPLPAVN